MTEEFRTAWPCDYERASVGQVVRCYHHRREASKTDPEEDRLFSLEHTAFGFAFEKLLRKLGVAVFAFDPTPTEPTKPYLIARLTDNYGNFKLEPGTASEINGLKNADLFSWNDEALTD